MAAIESLSVVAEDMAWMRAALCKGRPDLFFAPPGERRMRRTAREAIARAYCDNCRSLDACRTWARENREHGFWGGETEEQRARLGYPPRSPSRRAVAEIARSHPGDVRPQP